MAGGGEGPAGRPGGRVASPVRPVLASLLLPLPAFKKKERADGEKSDTSTPHFRFVKPGGRGVQALGNELDAKLRASLGIRYCHVANMLANMYSS